MCASSNISVVVQRILICDDYGGYNLSRVAFLRLRELGQPEALAEPDYGDSYDDDSIRTPGMGDSFGHEVPRDDPLLLQVFDELGQKAAGWCCHLKAVEIPAGIEWEIDQYDGMERVNEKHRSWS